jgi:acetoin utilization deacetylase AcuC-like enzyme
MQDEQKYKFIKDGIVSQIVWEGTKISKPSQNTLYILLECDKEDWLFRLKESKEDWLFRLNESKTEFADSIYDNKTKAFEKAFKKLKAPYKLILDTSSYTVRDCYETIIKTLKEINND